MTALTLVFVQGHRPTIHGSCTKMHGHLKSGASRPGPGTSRRRLVLMAALLACSVTPSGYVAETQAEYLDAYVEHDAPSGEWAIGNEAIRYTIAVGRDRSLRLVGLTTAGIPEPVTRDTEAD